MRGDFIEKRMQNIAKMKRLAPELSWLLIDVTGGNGIEEVNLIISRLEGIDTDSEPNVASWGRGMSIEALVAYLVKYKEDYSKCVA